MKWSRTFKSHNGAQAVIIYKILETEMEAGNGLHLNDVTEWKQVVTACRKGFRCSGGGQIKDRLRRVNFIQGDICSNGPDIKKNWLNT